MINWPIIFKLLGYIILGISASLCFPLAIAIATGDGGELALAASLLVGLTVGGSAVLYFKTEPHEINQKEGILFVVPGLGGCCCGWDHALPVFALLQRHY